MLMTSIVQALLYLFLLSVAVHGYKDRQVSSLAWLSGALLIVAFIFTDYRQTLEQEETGAEVQADEVMDVPEDEWSLYGSNESLRTLDPEEEKEKCSPGRVDSDFMKRARAALIDFDSRELFLFWENRSSGARDDSVSVVFVFERVRYTLWHCPSDEKNGLGGFISVWERPNGTHTKRWLDTHTDHNFTGCVNFAVGDESRLGQDRKLMHWNDEDSYDTGLEHYSFWQERYRRAMRGLAVTLGISPPAEMVDTSRWMRED